MFAGCGARQMDRVLHHVHAARLQFTNKIVIIQAIPKKGNKANCLVHPQGSSVIIMLTKIELPRQTVGAFIKYIQDIEEML